VAVRPAPTRLERAGLYWRSTPDYPSAQAAHRLVLTQEHLYVERADGSKQRVRRDDLRGRREEGGRIVYGVRDGADLALHKRGFCPVMSALDQALQEDAQPVATALHFKSAAKTATVMLAILWLFDMSSRSQVWRVAENPVRLLVFIPIIAFLYALLVRPERVRVDKLGLHRRFGFVPLFHENIPPERVEEVTVENWFGTGKQVGLKVVATLRNLSDVPRKERQVVIETFDTRSWGKVADDTIAHDLARQVAALLDAKMFDLSTR
jgi:hypothetical protein